MKLWYLDNSAYAVLLKDTAFVFDYAGKYTDSGLFAQGYPEVHALREFSRVYFLISHSHSDHFSCAVWKFRETIPQAVYIADAGVRAPEMRKVYSLSPGQGYFDEGAGIYTFGSTDLGVSFYVEAEGNKLFHAGDLNCWHWAGQNDAAHETAAREAFTAELDKIAKIIKELDLAMFPVDPRMRGAYADGADEFVKRFSPKAFVPMHFWGRFDVAAQYAGKVPGGVAPVRVGDCLNIQTSVF